MTSIITKARLPISAEDGLGVVGVMLWSPAGSEAIARSTSGVICSFEGDGYSHWFKQVELPDGQTQGVFTWDDGSGHGADDDFNIISGGGGESAQSGGGFIRARIAYASLTPDEFLQLIQGEERVITFILEADGRFDAAEADSLIVKLKDIDGNVVIKDNDSHERICEQLDIQVFRTALTADDTNALSEGLLKIEIAMDGQKAVADYSLKIIEAL